MPVHIDQIDSEIEIIPSSDADRRAAASTGSATTTTPAPPDGLRRAVVRALEEELQEYLRIRG